MKNVLLILLIRITFLLIFTFLVPLSLYCSKFDINFRVEIDDLQSSTFKITKLNDKDYLNLTKNYHNLFVNASFDYETGKIRFANYSLIISALSFFVVKDSAEVREIFQMNLPVLSIKNDLLVPLKPFLQSLEFFRIYKIEYINQNHIKIKRLYQYNPLLSKPFGAGGNERNDYRQIDKKIEQLKSQTEIRQNNIKTKIPKAPDTSKPDFLPNQYILPPNLFRKEMINPRKKRQIDSSTLNNLSSTLSAHELYASSFVMSEPHNTSFISIRYKKVSDNTIEIILTADNSIASYHKPEIKDGKLILRIPDAVNSIKKIQDISIPNFRSGIEVEYIRNFLLYKLTPLNEIDSLFSRRNGAKELIYSIVFKVVDLEKTNDSSIVTQISELGEKWKLDVIVIDPGHGGEDPGAISINGYKEKELTLAIALELRKLINEHLPDIKVVMTREDDRFVELYKRGKIANQANGKLFISIHLNSMPKKPHNSNGFETYILRPGRNEDAIRVAEKENSVIKYEKDQTKYKDFDEESIILATIAQSGFQKLSEMFAKIIQLEVAKTTPMKNRGVNQAGFYVLVGASMPNVLFEGGFLSNKEDEKFIISKDGQKKIALGLFNAIKRYVMEYQNLIHSENR